MGSILKRGAAGAMVLSLVLAGAANASSLRQSANAKTNATGASVDWPFFGNNSDNNRYSSLSQINDTNVSKLGIAWTASQGPKLSTYETDPVVVNGIMYYTTNLDQVRAADAATGKLLWQYTPKVNFYLAISGGGGGVPTNRGVTVANGNVYLLTFDNQLTALQASTGEKLWSTQVADPNQGYSETSPATYYKGLLILGSAESDSGRRGFVAAYNATTGKQAWRFFTVPTAGHGWIPKGSKASGGDVWMPQVVDEKTGLVYFGTGNPYPDFDNSQRPGCDPWVNATVALNALTGKFVWGHSEVCNDVWDYDSHQPPMIFDTTINGKTVHAVGHGNKSGLYFIYDAATGKVLAKSPYLGKYTLPHVLTAKGSLTCPGFFGGIEFSPPAYSPLTHLVYEPGLDACMVLGKGIFKAPTSTSGFMAAVDTSTGKIAWKTQMPKPLIGGAVATAGNLVFSGSNDNHFYAFDAKTGKVLWSANLGVAFGAAPITYQVNGTQYVAIAAGGLSASAFFKGLVTGGSMVVFKLNGKPITKVPAVTGGANGGLSEVVSVKGMTKVGPWEYVDAVKHHVVFKIVAASDPSNNGFNFNGYAKGKANFIVPAGWLVNFIFTNNAALPHSVGVTASLKLSVDSAPLGATPNPFQGIGGNQTQYAGFTVYTPGKFYMVCLVPGHIQAGMWDNFTVSATAKSPSISVQ
ncbi:MAG: Pyrrolo-quinoline quinone [Chloroflexi bacterium]|nr:Pyrrolo-quinoline quinone [Chloroflexota bacterium]